MFNLVGKSLDFTAIRRSGLPQADAIIDVVDQEGPDYVKSAALIEDEASEQLPDNQFALILYNKGYAKNGQAKVAEHRLFPIPNKAYTWLQVEAIKRSGDELPAEARKVASYHITNAARRHGIDVPDDLAAWGEGPTDPGNRVDMATLDDPVGQEKTAGEATAHEATHYALTRHGQHLFPLHTPALVKKAMNYIERYEHSFIPRDRHAFCTKVVDKAHEMGLAVTEKVASYGGTSYNKALDAMLRARESLLQSDEEHDALAKVASKKQTMDPREFANLLDEFDQATKIASRGAMPNAYQSALGPEGEAPNPLEGYSDRDIAGGVVTHQQKLSSYLGKGVVRQLAHSPRETYDQLDPDQRDVFHQVLAGAL